MRFVRRQNLQKTLHLLTPDAYKMDDPFSAGKGTYSDLLAGRTLNVARIKYQ